MGIRIVLADKEPVPLALRRFKRLLECHGVVRELRRRARFISPNQIRRAKRFKKKFKARLATLQAQQAGKQAFASLAEATLRFWQRTGKP
jgi:ribosomal protein S21